MRDAAALIDSVISKYPASLRQRYQRDVIRQAWHLEIMRSVVPPGGTIVDVGGGVSLFAPLCAAAGFSVILIDDRLESNDAGEHTQAKREALDQVIRPLGVSVMERDVADQGLGISDAGVDAFTSFGVLEHLHQSPKWVLHEMRDKLRPGGSLFIGTPNCVNLRKRITGLFGRAKWSSMYDWYEKPSFRGHVREPDIDDLRYIARDLCLDDARILGRNWIGYNHSRRWVRSLTPVADGLLRVRPGLCSDIYVLARKETNCR